MALPNLQQIPALPLIDRIKAYIVGAFSILVGIAFLASLGSMIYFKVTDPTADIALWVNVFLTCLGYIVGILTGLLGLPAPAPPSQGAATSG
jgi:xanthosine utilization system XapX-like protein